MNTTRFCFAQVCLVLAVLGCTLCWTPPLLAAANDQDRVAAQALFEQGKELIAAGRHAEACAKFDESQRLDPGIGTQFNLADCYERVGRFASAYTLYVDVAARSKVAGQAQRETIARERAEALKAKLTKLVVVIPNDVKVSGLEVTRDGVAVGAAQWGLQIPVDPGVHQVIVKAPGKKPWQGSIEVPNDAQEHSITVPTLQDAPAEPVQGPKGNESGPVDQPTKAWPLQKTLGLVAGGVGVVGLGVGGFFGLRAINKNKDSKEFCDENQCTDPGVKARQDARSAGDIATIGVAVGAVGLIGGAVLFFTAPSSEQSSPAARRQSWSALRVLSSVEKDRADLIVTGSF